ncbi:MAG: Maf family protein [Candidatus Acidiferrales bacterium]
MKLILASSSPRRAEILRNAGFAFESRASRVDESLLAHESSEDYVRRLALAKARAVAQDELTFDETKFILGADTVVVVEGQLLGKPSGADDARRMLHTLNGKTHEVLTGISILSVPEGPEAHHVATTRVTFLSLSDETIESYIASGEPFDKAGAYGIQGVGGRFVRKIEGCYFNVMGLPLSQVWTILQTFGWTDLAL